VKDLNFFESYNKNKDKHLGKDFILYGLAILFALGIILYSIINIVLISKLNSEVAILKQQVEVKKSNNKINEILEKENEIGELRKKFEQIRQVDDFIDTSNIVNEYLLDFITERVPENVFLNSMVFNANLITLDGVSKDKKSISDFQHKLVEIDYFEDIFIPAISYENDFYLFSMNIKPKEVDVVGNQDKE